MANQTSDTLCTCIYTPGDEKTKHKSLNSEFVLYQTWINRIIKEGGFDKVAPNGLYTFFKPEDKNDKKSLKEFDKTYKPNDAINWYTRETCIYRMMNKALRTHDLKTINAFGTFIHDLFKQLGDEHVPYVKKQETPTFHVYRGQLISKEELNRLKFSKNQCVSINSFLSTSTNRAKAIEFATSRPPPSDTLTTVLLEIETDSTISPRPFSDIKHLSAIPSEEEILFALGSVFRIDDVVEDKELNLWRAHFTVIIDAENISKEFARASTGLEGAEQFSIDFGMNLLYMNQYDQARNYFSQIIQKKTLGSDLQQAYAHYGLALTDDKNGNSVTALKTLDTALNILSQNKETKYHPLVAQCYNECGSIYCEQANFFEAMASYDKALGCPKNEESTTYAGLADVHYRLKNYRLAMEYQTKAIEKQPASDKALIANNYLLIAKIYAALGDGDKSLDAINTALELQKESLPDEHPDIGYTYSTRAEIISELFPEQDPSSDYEKALEIQQKSLLSTHPDFGDSYKNLGTFHAGKSNFDKSLSYFHKLLDNQLTRYSTNHPSVGETYRVLAETYWKKEDLDQSIVFYLKLLENQLSRLPLGSSELDATYQTLARVHQQKKDSDQAIVYYRRSLNNQLVKKKKDDASLTEIYVTLGKLSYDKNDLSNALIYYHRALDCEREKKPRDSATIQLIYDRIGKIYRRKSFLDESLNTMSDLDFFNAERLSTDEIEDFHFEKRQLDLDLSYFYRLTHQQNEKKYKIIGHVFLRKRDFRNALKYFQKHLNKEIEGNRKLVSSDGDLYALMGDLFVKVGDLLHASTHFHQALNLYERNSSIHARSIRRVRSVLDRMYQR